MKSMKFFSVLAVGVAALFLMAPNLSHAATTGSQAKTKDRDAKMDAWQSRMVREYWDMQREKLTAERDHLQAKLDLYKDNEKTGRDIKQDLADSQRKFDAESASIETRYHAVIQNEKAKEGAEHEKLLKERDDYLNQHPDVKADVTKLKGQIDELNQSLKKYEP